MVLEGWADRSQEALTTNGPPVQEAVILPLSARSTSALSAMAQSVRDTLARADGHANLSDLAFTAAVRRDHHEHRLALVASHPAEAIERLDEFLNGKAIPEVVHGRRLFGPRPGLVLVFSGQGGLWKGVGRDLFETEPVIRDAIEQCERPSPAMCPGRSSTSSRLARQIRALERPKSTNRFSSRSRWPSRHSGSHGGSSPISSSAIALVKSPPLTWPVPSASKTPPRSWPCAAAHSNLRPDEAGWSP